MNLVVDNRYVMEKEWIRAEDASIWKAKDLTLHREVLVYSSDPEKQDTDRIARVADLAEPRFIHILDGVSTGDHAYLILKSDDGEPLAKVIERQALHPEQAISVVIELGKGMQDALEAGISGFAVTVDNIWCSSVGKPLILDSWNTVDESKSGVLGLRLLLVQLLLGVNTLPHSEAELEAALGKALDRADYQDPSELVGLIRNAGRGQETLSSFLFHLRDLADGGANTDRLPMEPIFIRGPVSEHRPLLSGWRWLAGLALGGLAAIATLIWFVGHMGMEDPDSARLAAERTRTAELQRTETPKPLPTLNETMTASAERTSFGSAPVSQIPDLSGLTLAQAQQKAIASGLHYEYFIVSGEGTKGTVFKQSPAPGSPIDSGAKVTFWVNR